MTPTATASTRTATTSNEPRNREIAQIAQLLCRCGAAAVARTALMMETSKPATRFILVDGGYGWGEDWGRFANNSHCSTELVIYKYSPKTSNSTMVVVFSQQLFPNI